MCGIVGYIGKKFVDSVLLVGLERLEYRGYDSAGIATISNGELSVFKRAGKLKILDTALKQEPLGGNIGIGHTRWATHGEPNEINAHPHTDCSGKIAIVHNGIIENYIQLKENLIKEGHIFQSETDSEVIAHLIEKNTANKNFEEGTLAAFKELKGAYAVVAISEAEPDKIIAGRKGSPLIIGVGKEENFVASDLSAILTHTNEIVFLNEDEIAVISNSKIKFLNLDGVEVEHPSQRIEMKVTDYSKGEYSHFMLKEIYEQSEVIDRIIQTYFCERNLPVKFGGLTLGREYLAKVGKIIIQACGTSWHAGLIGKFLLEKYSKIHTEADISSEFRYRNPVLEGDTLLIAISQSGETADTLAGIRQAKSKFIKVLSICNVLGSSIARESDSNIELMAGPEIGVASTKAYTAELTILYLFAIYFSRLKWAIHQEQMDQAIAEILKAPDLIKKILQNNSAIEKCAEQYCNAKQFVFLGRGVNYPTALEGALKLKEISYIHATGYPAGEFKHGPIALIDENTPVIAIIPKGEIYPKMFSNILEVRARKGKVIAIATEGDEDIKNIANNVIYIPEIDEDLSPLLAVIPLQLFAYHVAVKKGCDVDKPRNLAKSVTVE
ncbi:MAG: glutamine--fructose-6-phosphate transaminase (isomerizing) [Candidatus Firestonebacteria bacterium]